MDDKHFEQMVVQYERLIYTICYQFTKDHYIAQDLSQETFLSAYNHLTSCPQDNPKSWLARIATNKAKDHLKSAYNRRVHAVDDDKIPPEKEVLFATIRRPDDVAVSKETVRQITATIGALKEPYHQVSVLFFIEEKSIDEIATQLDRPYKTVHTQLSRAKTILQQQLKGGKPDDNGPS